MTGDWRRPSLATRARLSAYVALRAPIEGRVPFHSAATIERAQRRHLRSTVSHAWEHVPYYKETMKQRGLTPADIRAAEDLAKLPIIEPDQLQRDPEYFVSRADPIERHVEIPTSGTSGEPRAYFRDTASVAKDAVHFTRLLAIAKRLAGKRLKLKQAFILPRVSTTRTVQEAYRAISLFPPRAGGEQTRLSLDDPPEENIARINELEPDVLFSFGSYLEALFNHLDGSGERLHPPAAVIYGADHLSDSVRSLISKKFGFQVLSAYSATEMPQIGFECDLNRGIHLNTDLYPLRIVDSGGGEVPTGESGEVVASNLVNRGTVLLNYRLGDIARRLQEPCPCGRNLSMISLLEGRSEDWLMTESGRPIHAQAIAPFWKAFAADIRRYQLIQEAPARIRMVIVAAPGSDHAALRAGLKRNIREIFGDGTTLDVSFSDSLPRTEAGKVRAVISKLGQAGP